MPLKVFYLDDESDLLVTFADIFGSADIEIRCFDQPEEFLSETKKDKPDVIFVDFRLRGLSGEDVAKRVDQQIPRALISGDINIQTELKFDVIFRKPYELERIQDYLVMLASQKASS